MEIKCSWVRHKAKPPPHPKKKKKKKNTKTNNPPKKKTNPDVSSHGSCDKIKKSFILHVTAVMCLKRASHVPPGRNAL